MTARSFRPVCAVVLAIGALVGCGDDGERAAGDPDAPTTPSAVAPTTESTAVPSTAATSTSSTADTSTASVPSGVYSVTRQGLEPGVPLGATSAAGSGCAPGDGVLPDGVWFGWIVGADDAVVRFDLACLVPGRVDPLVTDDSDRVRDVPVDPGAAVHESGGAVPYDAQRVVGGDAAVSAPGLPAGMPAWLFVNGGVVTEVSPYRSPIRWRTAAWPGLFPGCCESAPTVPASPAAALPDEGWPSDGFYAVDVRASDGTGDPGDAAAVALPGTDGFEVTVHPFVPCADVREQCLDIWSDDVVVADADREIVRTLTPDDELTVVLMPVEGSTAVAGHGVALRDLLGELHAARSEHAADLDAYAEDGVFPAGDDPSFPFGLGVPLQVPQQRVLAFRGPGGTHLVIRPWWTVLEIRGGQPILYAHAGIWAG
jgi:hypothetical protein